MFRDNSVELAPIIGDKADTTQTARNYSYNHSVALVGTLCIRQLMHRMCHFKKTEPNMKYRHAVTIKSSELSKVREQ